MELVTVNIKPMKINVRVNTTLKCDYRLRPRRVHNEHGYGE